MDNFELKLDLTDPGTPTESTRILDDIDLYSAGKYKKIISFKFKQVRGKEFIDLDQLNNMDLLTTPYAYNLFIEGLNNKLGIIINLYFADSGKIVPGVPITYNLIYLGDMGMKMTINFMVNSFLNKGKTFKFIVFSGEHKILETIGGFYLLARCRKRKRTKTKKKTKKKTKTKTVIEDYTIKKNSNKTKIHRLCLWDTSNVYRGYVDIEENRIDNVSMVLASVGIKGTF